MTKGETRQSTELLLSQVHPSAQRAFENSFPLPWEEAVWIHTSREDHANITRADTLMFLTDSQKEALKEHSLNFHANVTASVGNWTGGDFKEMLLSSWLPQGPPYM